MPETAFAFNLKNTLYEKMLKELSYQIIIITGAFNIQEGKTYNSTYIFKGGNSYILNKHFLVPFGEENSIFQKNNTKILLTNMARFDQGPLQSKYKLNDQIITNAICYEATKEQNYKKFKNYYSYK